MPSIEQLRALCGGPRDGALLRLSLGNALLESGDRVAAIVELRRALQLDADYSAAWKALGHALADSGALSDAIAAYRDGIAAAQRRGDKQAEKEMTVFLKRLHKQADA